VLENNEELLPVMIVKNLSRCLKLQFPVRRWSAMCGLIVGCLSAEAAIPLTDSPVAHWN
jgi:hypothetical protein